MNFSSAMLYLRDGQCAKTPSMNGYVKRVDFSSSMTDPGSGNYGHSVYAAYNDATPENRPTAVYDVVFAENSGYTDTDSKAQYAYRYMQGGATPGWSYIGSRAGNSGEFALGSGETASASGVAMDATLFRLASFAQDWSTFPADEVEAAVSSTARW